MFFGNRVARSGVLLVALVIVASIAVGLSTAHAYPRPGRTERVPTGNNGAQHPAISADGRYLAMMSRVRLVPGDTNGDLDVFVHDLQTGDTERVSVASDGTQGNGDSGYDPSISPDGRYVVFWSDASNLVPGDTNEATDTFVHDRVSGATERVSVANEGIQGNGPSSRSNMSISEDGRYVAFSSAASNLVPDDVNGALTDVFVHDRETGATELVSVAGEGPLPHNSSFYPSMSADGRYVAFFSFSGNVVPDDTNATNDVYLHDRATGATERVSVASDGTEGNGPSWRDPSISADGRYVAFYASASNLVPGDTNGAEDVFVHDRETGATERVSVASDGAEGNGNSQHPSISPDGRYVAFHSLASNLAPGDTNDAADTFVHDRETGATERVSVASGGAQGNSDSYGYPSISAGGRIVAFHSQASNFAPDDTNGAFGFDVFVRDRGGPVEVRDLSAVVEGDGISVSGSATFTGQAVASAMDAADDGLTGAEEAGGELTEAGVFYRPEQEDLLVNLDLASLPSKAVGICPEGICLPGASTGAGAPAILYGLELNVGGSRYEVRALRAGAAAVPPAVPLFALYLCEVVCLEQARLTGGLGTTGAEIVISVPVSEFGSFEGASMEGIRAFTAFGEAAPGAMATLDEVDLPDAIIPEREVSLGIAPVATPADQVVFAARAVLEDSAFSGLVNAPPGAGNYHVWARACLGETCQVEKVSINIE